MGALMRSLDWSKTLLGPVSRWPQSLRTSVSTCLNSRFAIVIWWGPGLVMLYNDAYRDIIAAKHPAALGCPGRECWPEIWHIVGPMLDNVLRRGEATWSNDLLLLLERNGYPEECYFTFSYSPIRDESGGVGGVFTPVAETTDHIIGERRLRTLRDLATRTSRARGIGDACTAAADTLADNPYDIPFAGFYIFDEARSQAGLTASAGIEAGSKALPRHIVLAAEETFSQAELNGSRLRVIEDLAGRAGPLPGGAWETGCRSGVVLPILMPGQTSPFGFLLAGVSPRKRLDQSYRTFFELVGAQISKAIADARAHEEEQKRLEALSEIDRMKTAFFSNVSHEFRTPLTLMLGPIEAMIEHAPPGETRDELRLVHRNGIRLLKLVNTLLDFTRIEAGRAEAVYEATDLGSFTADIASSFRSAMESAGIQFIVDCPCLDERAYVDRDMWEKIVLNLISNAFKFTVKGYVRVGMRRAGEWLELRVEDSGAGIPEKQLPHIFERFYRVDGARGRTHEGTGIGLALVNELTKLHGGSIRVESAEEKGSVFTVSIPLGHAHLPAGRIGSAARLSASVSAAYVDEALRWLPESERPPNPALFASDSVQAPHIHKVTGRILLADDNADMRDYVRRLLGSHYQVEAASNGVDALAAVQRNPPDLVLTDVMMPGIDGFGFLRELRASESTRTIPVILLSARAGEEARVEGLNAGADDYIVKPFTARELLARVDMRLRMSRLRLEAGARERALRAEAEAAQERTANILESISDAFLSLDADWQFQYVNAEAERSTGKLRQDLIGRRFWDVFPETLGTDTEAQYRRVMQDRTSAHIDLYYAPRQRWFDVRLYPARNGGLSVFYQDITDRKRTDNAMRVANQALRAANADLEQFAYSATHDLREPLRAVRAYCELLKRKFASKVGPEGDQMIDFAVDGAIRMNAMLDDLLTYIQASADEKIESDIPLEAALDTALRNLSTAIEETGATITRDPLPEVRMAPVHAQQIFQNLIGNALKYRSASPPRVHVRAQRDGGAWILSVQDNGIGIDPEYAAYVFGLFKRIRAASGHSGTGIGLALCKKLVERYGGRIWIQSEPGRGSTFFFSVPEAR
jgi:PAS domain S-box-containing protein